MNRDVAGRIRIAALALLFTLGFGAVVARLFQIQVYEHEAYAGIALKEVTASALIERERGSIRDRNGRDLAVSLPVKSVFVDPEMVADRAGLARRLAAALGLDAADIAEKIRRNGGRRFVWIARKVDGDAARRVEAIRDPGVGFVREYKRTYPFGPTAAHLLGFAGLDSVGLEGLELAYDEEIRGPAVEVDYVRDVQGNPIPRDGRIVYPHFEGRDLVLSLDLLVQSEAERALAEAIARHEATSGSVVAVDPWTGEVIAMASAPAYDPNRFAEATPAARRNRAVTDVFEPGSVFKAFVAAGLLERGVVRPETRYRCAGEVEVAGFRIRCTDRHGDLSFREVIEKSCNVGMIEAARALDPDALHDLLETLGFGTMTGADLPGERAGLLRPVRQWSALSRSTLAIGQEVSVTALQLARAAGALATGRLVRPHLVREVRDADGAILRGFEPERGPLLFSPKTIAEIRSILRGAVEEGTGRRASIDGFAVAGKTGTAQIAGPGGYTQGRYNATFVGWAPADSPVVAIAVVVSEPNPSKGYYGGAVAAPVFRSVGQAALRARRLLPHAARATAAAGAGAAAPERRAGLTPDGARGVANGPSLPDFRGYTMREVHEALTFYPLRVRLIGSGVAFEQDPPPGTPLREGATVTVRFGLREEG